MKLLARVQPLAVLIWVMRSSLALRIFDEVLINVLIIEGLSLQSLIVLLNIK